MVQGIFKNVVARSPKKKKGQAKNSAFTRRSNAPIQPKKMKFTESQKIKQSITKKVNKSFEAELRARASNTNLNLSKVQEAVAKFHKDDSNNLNTITSS